VPEDFPLSARQLVDSAINNAKNAKLPIEGAVVLVTDTASDILVEDRAEALRAALRDAGVTAIEELHFARDDDAAKKKVAELLKTNPKPGMVFSTDKAALTASYNAMEDLGGDRTYIVAGYSSDESGANMARAGEFAAVAIFSAERLIRKAITTAALAAGGQKFSERVELKIPVHVSPLRSGAPRKNAILKAKKEASGKQL
jgi:ABC-type sugar transport system substrate-binding protein